MTLIFDLELQGPIFQYVEIHVKINFPDQYFTSFINTKFYINKIYLSTVENNLSLSMLNLNLYLLSD